MKWHRVAFTVLLGGTMGAIAGHMLPELRPWSPLAAGVIVGIIFVRWAAAEE